VLPDSNVLDFSFRNWIGCDTTNPGSFFKFFVNVTTKFKSNGAAHSPSEPQHASNKQTLLDEDPQDLANALAESAFTYMLFQCMEQKMPGEFTIIDSLYHARCLCTQQTPTGQEPLPIL